MGLDEALSARDRHPRRALYRELGDDARRSAIVVSPLSMGAGHPQMEILANQVTPVRRRGFPT
jgi:hypothetical protein